MVQILVNVDVDDVARATTFYCDAFGFTVGRRVAGAFVELLGAGAPLYLLPKADGSLPFAGAMSPRTSARHWTPVHLDIAVDDLDAALARALAAGARREGATSVHPYGRLALLADPFGNGFCFLEFNDRGYDALVTSRT